MGVIAKGILRGCQGLFTPVSLGYPLSVFNKNSTLKSSKSSYGCCNSNFGQNVAKNHEVDERKKEPHNQVAQQHYLLRAAPHCNVDT